MDVFSKIHEILQLIYTFIPQEVFIIIMAGLILGCIEFLRKGNNEENNEGKKN